MRTSYRMALDLGEPTSEAVWPDGVEAARLCARRRGGLLRPASGELQGHLGADRGDLRRVGSPVPRARGSGSCAVDSRSRRSRACRLRDVPPPCRGQRTRVGARPRSAQPVSWTRTRPRAPPARVHAVSRSRTGPSRTRSGFGESDRSEQALRVGRNARLRTVRDPREGRARELLARALPELQDVHGGGHRRRLRVSQLREHLLGRARARACGVGSRGRGHGRRRADRSSVSGGRRGRARHARRADRSRGRVARRPADRGRWLLLHARRAACEASRGGSTASASSGSTLTATSTHPRHRRREISGGCRFA